MVNTPTKGWLPLQKSHKTTQKLTVLDLFSGIGGFSLGLESTGGFETVGFCEIEPFCVRVLNKHWPQVPVFNDVRTLKYGRPVDIVTGGFPCQDLSAAGNQRGLQAERSGLWYEMLRICGEVVPRYIVVENVSNLLTGERGCWFATFLRDLAQIGYDVQWHCIPAAAVGAVHRRDRIWAVAYPSQKRRHIHEALFNSITSQIADCRASRAHLAILARYEQVRLDQILQDHRKLDGISAAVDTTGALGNTVFPKIPYIIGNAILAAERASAGVRPDG
jgi:DNA (cytosine-5)-methyltransferase 1